jgi:hypothetical protein
LYIAVLLKNINAFLEGMAKRGLLPILRQKIKKASVFNYFKFNFGCIIGKRIGMKKVSDLNQFCGTKTGWLSERNIQGN